MNLYSLPHSALALNLTKHLLTSNPTSSHIIIAANQYTERACAQLIKQSSLAANAKVVKLSEPQSFLEAFAPLTPQHLATELQELKQKSRSVLKLQTQNFMLAAVIEKLIPDNRGFTQILNLAEECSKIISFLEWGALSLPDLTQNAKSSIFKAKILDIVVQIFPIWQNILKSSQVISEPGYHYQVSQLVGAIIRETKSDTIITSFPLTTYTPPLAILLKALSEYKNAHILFGPLNLDLPEETWLQEVERPSHPDHVSAKLLRDLHKNRTDLLKYTDISPELAAHYNPQALKLMQATFSAPPLGPTRCPRASTTDGASEHSEKPTLLSKESQPLPLISLATLTQPSEEAAAIVHIIEQELPSAEEPVLLVCNNLGLLNRVKLKLKQQGIGFKQNSRLSILSFTGAQFFMELTQLNCHQPNWLTLLSILKSPLCTAGSPHLTQLIDYHFARSLAGGETLEEILKSHAFKATANSEASPRAASAPLASKHERSQELNPNLTAATYQQLQVLFKTLTSAAEPLEQLKNAKHSFDNFLQAHIGFFKALTSEPANLTPLNPELEKETQCLWGELSKIKQEEFLMKQEVTYQEYIYLLKRWLMNVHPQPKRSSSAQVHICELSQTRYLAPACVIVADLNEGSIPSNPGDITIIEDILKNKGLPTSLNTMGQNALLFSQLCSVPKVYLTRSTSDQRGSTQESRFLLRLRTTLMRQGQQLARISPQANLAPQHSPSSPAHTLVKATPEASARPRQISATAIEQLLENPYLFYVNHVLKIRPLNAINPPFGAREAGILIHSCLEKIVGSLQQQVNQHSFEELAPKPELASTTSKTAREESAVLEGGPLSEQKVHAIVVRSIKSIFSTAAAHHGEAALAEMVMLNQSRNLAQKFHSLLSAGHKLSVEKGMQASCPTEGGNLTITGVADCVATLNHNATIIDYKTGNFILPKTKLETNPKKQLTILGYLWITEQCKRAQAILAPPVESKGETHLWGENLEFSVATAPFKVESLLYWCFSRKKETEGTIEVINFQERLQITDLSSYIQTDISYLQTVLQEYLLTPKEFVLAKPKDLEIEILKPYQHFARTNIILK